MRVQVSPRAPAAREKTLDFDVMETYLSGETMRNLAATLCLVLTFVGAAGAEVIKSTSLQASSDGVNITVRWVTEDETNVARFDIERRADNDAGYTAVASLDPKGPSLY